MTQLRRRLKLSARGLTMLIVVVILLVQGRARATNHELRLHEVMVGANGNSKIQFIVIQQGFAGQNLWGPQPGETQSRAMLVFFDASGRETGKFKFPTNPPTGGSLKTLIATQNFADLPDAPTPNFIIPPLLNPISGKVCFKNNPANPFAFSRNECLSYGSFTGSTETNFGEGGVPSVAAGPPAAPAGLPIMNTVSLRRTTDTGRNSDFQLVSTPTPTNIANATCTIAVATQIAQGESVFTNEAFGGNGRSCATCHVAGESFRMTPGNIQSRFSSLASTFDPLFIGELKPSFIGDVGFDFNLNTLDLTAAVASNAPCTGELRGIITTPGGGRAKVLGRVSGTRYLIYGGANPAMSAGLEVSDSFSCSAIVSSVTAGDLARTEASGLDGLESPRRMRTSVDAGNFPQGRGLILENVDGIGPPLTAKVFRKSPHLLNMNRTAPFGFSGDVPDLQEFLRGAIIQHYPRTLARSSSNANPDFRTPTAAELQAAEAFMLAQEFPSGTDPNKFDLDRFATTAAQKRGRELFFGSAKCSQCHGGAVLASTTVSVQGKAIGVNASFNTGVVNQSINSADGLPSEQAGLREFNTPQLFNVKNLGPFFHDSSAATVQQAVEFYTSPAFNTSASGLAIGGIAISSIEDVVAFLDGLAPRPYLLSVGLVRFGSQTRGTVSAAQSFTITNTSAAPITFTGGGCTLTGPDLGEFVVTSCPLGTPLAAGQTRTVQVTFNPSSDGAKTAVLEINAPDASGVALFGTGGPLGAAPTVGSIAPTSGSTLGGTAVTITGTNFVAGATVAIGGVAAGSVVVVNATTITASTGARSAGVVDVVVTNPDAQVGTLANGFTYSTPPTITSIAPTAGSTSGGSPVTISGTGFTSGATVAIGGVAATSVTVVNATTITATTGARAAGTVNVVVTNPDSQAATLLSGFTYTTTPAPTISSIGPPSGATVGGTAITIRGTGFTTPATLSIGGVAATNVVVVNATTITATTGARAAATVAVVVTNPDAQAGTLANGFTYNALPSNDAFANRFLITGGGALTATGSNVGATLEAGETATMDGVNFSGSTTAWWTWTAPCSFSVTQPNSFIDTIGSSFDTVLGVFTGSTLPLTPFTSDDQAGGANTSRVPSTAGGSSFGPATLNIAAGTVFQIRVRGFGSSTGTIVLHVNSPCVAPGIGSISPISGSAAGGTNVTISGSDFSTGPTVTIGGVAPTNVVRVNATTITATTGARAAGVVDVVVTNSDGQVGTLTNGFTYTAAPGNNAPTITAIAAPTTNEDTATSAIAFTVGDAETAAGSLTVSGSSSNTTLVPNANIAFGGSGASRTVTVTPALNQFGTSTITVSVSDGTASTPTTFLLTVNAVNDAPTITAIAAQTTNEDTATSAIAFTVGDVETAAASLTVSGTSSDTTLVPNANIVFGGSGASRTVTVTPALNQFGTSTITVTVSDGTASTPTTYLLTVTAVNDAPTITAIAAQTINEDTVTGALAFTVGDVETAAASLTVSGSSSNTTLVPNANVVFGGSGASRTVTVTPALNQFGTSTITVTVSDGTASTPTTYLLTVTAVNDAPTITAIAAQTINEDTATGALAFTVGDVETAAGTLTVSGGSSNTTLVPNANIVFGGSGASRTVTVTPGLNQFGTSTITVTASDGTASTPATFVLTVTAVNDAPTITAIAAPTTNEDTATGALAFTVGDVETAAASLTVSGSSSDTTLVPNANVVFGGSGASRTVTVTPAANLSGTSTITVTVSDGTASTPTTFLLTVTAVNDAPTVTAIAAQTTTEDTATGAIAFTVGDVETAAASLTVSGSSSNTTLVPNGNVVFGGSGASRTVTVTPALNQPGTSTITVSVSDGTTSTPTTFVLTVTGANDPPTITAIAAQTTNEDTPTGAIAFTVGDVETAAGSLTMSGSSSNTTLVPNANITFGGSGASRTVTVTPALNQFGTSTITVSVSDGTTSTPTTFVLTVTAVNDAPTITTIAAQTTGRNTATSALAVTVGDVETAAASLTMSGSSSNTTLVPNANIVFGGSGASRTVTVTPAPNQFGTSTITVTVSDGTTSTPTTFVLTVTTIASSIAPGSGPTFGGTPVTITGIGFAAGDTVSIGGVPATNVVVVSTTTITATTGAHAAGVVDIVVATADSQASTLSSRFTYRTLPTNNNFANRFVLTGSGALTATGSNAGFTAEAGEPAAVFGNGTASAWWTWTAPCSFTVTSPASLFDTTGSSFDTVLGVFTGSGFPLTSIANDDEGGGGGTSKVPASGALNIVGGTVFHIRVQGASGALSGSITLHVNSPCTGTATVASIAPAAGSAAGGTNVTITGTNFAAPATVAIGGVAATSVVVVNPTTIAATTGARAAGLVDVVVFSAAGPSGTLELGFTYVSSGGGGPTNDAPTITAIAGQTTNQGTATGAIAFTVGDAQTAAGSLTVSGSSSNTTLVPNANIVFGGTGASRTVTVTPAPNQVGTATITVTVSDGTDPTSTTFVLTVLAVNSAPTITSIAAQATDEDTATGAIAFTVGDAQTAAASLTVSASSSNTTLVPDASIVIGGSGASRTLTMTPTGDLSGTASITVTVSDGTLSANTTFVLTVTAVNDAPTISGIGAQTIDAETATGAIAFTVGDVETPATGLTVSGSSSNTTLVPNANIVFGGSGASRTVTVTPARNASGAATITVTVVDGNLAGTTTTFVLTVNPRPTVSVDRVSLNFAATSTGTAFTSRTSGQTVQLSQSGGGTVTWTAVSSAPWLVVSPASGSGSAALTISTQFVAGLVPSQTAGITLTFTGATNTAGPIAATLTVVTDPAVSPPFGIFDTPVGDATVLSGSIAVTGWALDNVGVQRVELWRDLQPGETTVPFASTATDPRHGKVFIANATFVDNARPDLEALHPTMPFTYRAGWGYLLMTWGLWNQGNGTYKFYAYAFDQEDNVATLGTKTVVVSNETAARPFGTIDTPSFGGVASGPNFGWALTPKVNGQATCKIQPSGVQVSIDSGPLQPVVYGANVRADIAAAFPGFSNSAAAGGHYIFDWSTLSNGTHTIGWLVTDDCNRAEGVGSRFFNVSSAPGLTAAVTRPENAIMAPETESLDPITVARGYGELPVILTPEEAGSRTVEVAQTDRIVLRLPRGFGTAYQLGPDGQRRALPTGATWDAASGSLFWQPAPGFLGRYRIVFSNGHERISVRIVVRP